MPLPMIAFMRLNTERQKEEPRCEEPCGESALSRGARPAPLPAAPRPHTHSARRRRQQRGGLLVLLAFAVAVLPLAAVPLPPGRQVPAPLGPLRRRLHGRAAPRL